jgi:hypothetical protein
LDDKLLRLWKGNPSYTKPEKLADFLKHHDIGHPETLKKLTEKPVTDEPDIEENTGVEFPGYQFDTFLDKTFRDLDRTSNSIHYNYDLIVVETATDAGQFIFRYNKNPGTYGKCENCYNTGILRVKCQCKKVAYCNEQCRLKDERFHLANCDAENVVDF